MRLISSIVFIGMLVGGYVWVSKKKPEWKNRVMELINSGSFHTLEARFTPQQIMDQHKRTLLKDEHHKYLPSKVKFYPYLFMEVKYTDYRHAHTGEGIILWDLMDGEKLINTKNWEKTHGYGDCIKAGVEKSEFKILNLLAQRGGALDREGLSRALHIENDILDAWIDACRKKKLVVQNGNLYRLHLQQPRLNVLPETIVEDRLVTKSYKNAERLARRFSPSQIRRIAEAAFGNDFAIRNMVTIYLPVYCITVLNPDGSEHTSYWNALNGKELNFTSLIE
ncbi:MAG: hypothetical protein MRY21_00495 [Simkaniaceae bacterium]|nr:hypothetical protein [Simkaniaceae bacterium]